MASNPEIYWTGASGKQYGYWINPIGTAFKDEPGNYIYAKKNTQSNWVAQYIGQTESLKDRLADHEKEICSKRHGATHVHAHVNSDGKQARLSEESDLTDNYNPPCNG